MNTDELYNEDEFIIIVDKGLSELSGEITIDGSPMGIRVYSGMIAEKSKGSCSL